MSPGHAKRLLGCSYTTLHNYVNRKIIGAKKHPVNGQLILNDNDVMKLVEKLDDSRSNVMLLEKSNIKKYHLDSSKMKQLKKLLEEE